MPRCSKRQRSSASTPVTTTIPSHTTHPHSYTYTPTHVAPLTHIPTHLTTSTLEPHHHNKRSRHSSGRRCSKSEDSTFSVKRCLAWYREYKTADEPDVLGPEGMEKFCEDIGVEPENVVMLVLAYKMGAKQMGFFTQEEWFQGLAELQCDSISKLQGKLDYLRSLLSDPHQFKGIYRYAYDFARDKDQRSLDAVTGRAMLQLLLGGAWPLLPKFCAFLETSRYKVINRDQWCNILEFSRTVSLHLDNYDADGAWPVMLDEFVEWLRQEREQIDTVADS